MNWLFWWCFIEKIDNILLCWKQKQAYKKKQWSTLRLFKFQLKESSSTFLYSPMESLENFKFQNLFQEKIPFLWILIQYLPIKAFNLSFLMVYWVLNFPSFDKIWKWEILPEILWVIPCKGIFIGSSKDFAFVFFLVKKNYFQNHLKKTQCVVMCLHKTHLDDFLHDFGYRYFHNPLHDAFHLDLHQLLNGNLKCNSSNLCKQRNQCNSTTMPHIHDF